MICSASVAKLVDLLVWFANPASIAGLLSTDRVKHSVGEGWLTGWVCEIRLSGVF